MTNGCLCCVLVGQMKEGLLELKEKYNPDRIIIETSGSAFPGNKLTQLYLHILLCLHYYMRTICSTNLRLTWMQIRSDCMADQRIGRRGVCSGFRPERGRLQEL